MTHTSDLSYLTRSLAVAYTSLWFLQHVWFIDRFASLKWSRVKRFELKSVITILLLLACPSEAVYDISIAIVKYKEGYIPDPFNPGEYIGKPPPIWSKEDKDFVVPINYVLCANLSVQTCLLFLLQSFWNYLASSLTRSSFMGSFEFKLYIVFSICTAILFPTLQFLFSSNQLNAEIAPQFAYGIIMLIIALLGFRSDYRFRKLLMYTSRLNPKVNILSKLNYFRYMNQYLTIGLLSGSVSLTVLSVDGLTKSQFLNRTKFFSDLLIVQLNVSIWVVFVSLMLIFYPAKISDIPSSPPVNNNINSNNSNNSNVPSTPKMLYSPTVNRSTTSIRDNDYTIKIIDNENKNKNKNLLNVEDSLDDGMSGSTITVDKKSNRFNFIKTFRF